MSTFYRHVFVMIGCHVILLITFCFQHSIFLFCQECLTTDFSIIKAPNKICSRWNSIVFWKKICIDISFKHLFGRCFTGRHLFYLKNKIKLKTSTTAVPIDVKMMITIKYSMCCILLIWLCKFPMKKSFFLLLLLTHMTCVIQCETGLVYTWR